MGSSDGAEICELVGLYIQSKLQIIPPKSNFELYREDGLALLRTLNGQQTNKVRRKTSLEYLKILILRLRLKLISKK